MVEKAPKNVKIVRNHLGKQDAVNGNEIPDTF